MSDQLANEARLFTALTEVERAELADLPRITLAALVDTSIR